jgi:hypothetical protein
MKRAQMERAKAHCPEIIINFFKAHRLTSERARKMKSASLKVDQSNR